MFHPDGPTLRELAVQALSSTRRGYDLLAPKFDLTPFRTPDALLESVTPHIGEPGSVESAVDLCCGTGAGLEMLAPLCRERTVGIDFSAGMLAVVRKRLPFMEGRVVPHLVQGDVLAMPFREMFDVAICFGALGHIPDDERGRFLQEVRGALRPGGLFVFPSSHRPSLVSPAWWLSRGFNAAMRLRNALVRPPFIMYYLRFILPEIADELETAGFSVETRADVFPEPFSRLVLVIATRR